MYLALCTAYTCVRSSMCAEIGCPINKLWQYIARIHFVFTSDCTKRHKSDWLLFWLRNEYYWVSILFSASHSTVPSNGRVRIQGQNKDLKNKTKQNKTEIYRLIRARLMRLMNKLIISFDKVISDADAIPWFNNHQSSGFHDLWYLIDINIK